MSALVVLIPTTAAGPGTEFDYVLTADGQTVQAHASAPAALLPQPAGAAAELVAVVPAAALSWHRVNLPKGAATGSPRLRAVLEGLLEDRVLDEPDTLHFALQPLPRAGIPAWVAVCDRAWLRSAIQVLEGAGRPVSRIVPEFAPEGPLTLHALGEAPGTVLVAAGDDGVTLVSLAVPALALLPALPEPALLFAEPAAAAQAEHLLQRQAVLQQAPQRWLRAAQSAWDLAQFDLTSSGQARAFKKAAALWFDFLQAARWRPARWGAALLVAVNLIGLNAWAWKERSVLQGKRDAIRRVLTQTFPAVQLVVDAPLQMEKEVAALRQRTGAASGRDMEAMLGALGGAAPPQRPVSALEFSNGQLRLKGLTYGAGEVRSVAASLRAQGYTSTVLGDTMVITQVNGR